MREVIKKCDYCEKEIQLLPWNIPTLERERGTYEFCSEDCKKSFDTEFPPGKEPWSGVEE
ncbi:TPA_asm: hypothetical protein vir519_00039 [Caudoviricetes sp. vir519]|nr:TPA_asm: hypothetical protein vir519_00039 [Caudoviricetes sp. vir519]